jgi:hypothetical protein
MIKAASGEVEGPSIVESVIEVEGPSIVESFIQRDLGG